MVVESQLRPQARVVDGHVESAEIDEGKRTEGKDDAFVKMEQLREAGNLQGRTVQSIADEIGWSRQHVNNVIADYYERVEPGQEPTGVERPVRGGDAKSKSQEHTFEIGGEGGGRQVHIEIPANVRDPDSYLKGYVDCITQS